jgi:hypothetical protein
MLDPTGIRRRSILRQEAGVTLRHFLRTVEPYNPPSRTKHFKSQFRSLQSNKRRPSFLSSRRLKRLRELNPEAYRHLGEDQRINQAFFDILLASSSKQPPSQDCLNKLRNGLNREIEEIGFFPGRISPAGSGPYMPAKLDAMRAASDLLLRYLNLSYHYGAVHTVCERCGSLMTTGRGGKKFCSPECRKAVWSYASKSDYYKDKQKIRRTSKKLRRT